MSPATTPRARSRIAFGDACDALGAALAGGDRRRIVQDCYRDGDFSTALRRLRTGMRAHAFATGSRSLALHDLVVQLDGATRREGFHVFLEWHEVAYRFIEDDIPVVLVDAVAAPGALVDAETDALAILLDYYFLYLLALCATRVWDEGDAGRNLDRVTALLHDLQGPRGSGRRFADDAETLLWLAISTYEPDDLAYHRLLARVSSLADPWRSRIGMVGAPLLGCHLRWGFPHLYECDLWRMRADNFIDYPWLLFSVERVMEEYVRLARPNRPDAQRGPVAAALLNGLSPDADAFLGEPPASLAGRRDEHARLREQLLRHRDALLADFARLRPEPGAYSPLGFHFNFPHNAVFALAALPLLGADVPNASLNALLTGEEDGGTGVVLALADRLTAFAAANPEPRGSRSVLGVYYDAEAAARAFTTTLDSVAATLERAGS